MPLPDLGIIGSLYSVLSSKKVQLSATTVIGAWFAIHYAAPTIPPEQRATLWEVFIGGVIGLAGIISGAWAHENSTAVKADAVISQANAETVKASAAIIAATSQPTSPLGAAALNNPDVQPLRVQT